MIPKRMEEYLRDHLPKAAIQRRRHRHDGRCYLEFEKWSFNWSKDYFYSIAGENVAKMFFVEFLHCTTTINYQAEEFFDLSCKPKWRPEDKPLGYDVYSYVCVEIGNFSF